MINSLLASPGSCDQDQLVLIFYIHEFSKCVTGILSLVMGDDVTHDSSIIDTCGCICFLFLMWWGSVRIYLSKFLFPLLY